MSNAIVQILCVHIDRVTHGEQVNTEQKIVLEVFFHKNVILSCDSSLNGLL